MTPLNSRPHCATGLVAWRAAAIEALAYLGCLAAAVPSVFRQFGRAIPGGGPDPAIHLWTMRWYERCLAEGRLPFFSDGLNHPTGIPTGLNPALHLPALEFLLLGRATSDDTLRYDVIWLLAFLGTALATAWLARSILRDRLSAWLAGLMAMLSAPMILHGHGHIELIQVGAIPLFLGCWIRWLDRPGRGRLLAAVGSYLLVAMSAQYYALMVIAPALVGLAFAAARGEGGPIAWLRRRLPGLLAFGVLAAAGLGLLYSGHLFAMARGVPMERPRHEFRLYSVPWWGYFVPLPGVGLDPAFARDVYTLEYGSRIVEIGSYLGLATLGLLLAAALGRVAFPGRALWWTLLGTAVVLSFGEALRVGSLTIPMPSALLYEIFPPIRLTRVPARYNVIATVTGAVIAAAAFRGLTARLPRAWMRPAAALGLAALIVCDQGYPTYPCSQLIPTPTAYATLTAKRPGAAMLEIPQGDPSGGPEVLILNGRLCYWQSHHRLRTTAGYTAVTNRPFEDLLGNASPFLDRFVRRPDYAEAPTLPLLDIVPDADLTGSAWLLAQVHRIDYLVVHSWFAGEAPLYREPLARLCRRLEPARVLSEGGVDVFDPARLPTPTRPVALAARGWTRRLPYRGRTCAGLKGPATVAVYNPDDDGPRELAIEAIAAREPTQVRLRDGARTLAEWTVGPGDYGTFVSPPFPLAAGRHDLTLEVADPPARPRAEPTVGVSVLLFRRALPDASASPPSPPSQLTRRPPDAPRR